MKRVELPMTGCKALTRSQWVVLTRVTTLPSISGGGALGGGKTGGLFGAGETGEGGADG